MRRGSCSSNTVVLERDRVRWFSFTDSGVSENPALSVTGLSSAVAFAVDTGGGYETAVVDGTQVKHYSFTGSSMAYNSVLSVTSGLANPRAVAIRPGSYRRFAGRKVCVIGVCGKTETGRPRTLHVMVLVPVGQ